LRFFEFFSVQPEKNLEKSLKIPSLTKKCLPKKYSS
jgi:hypothetical protein